MRGGLPGGSLGTEKLKKEVIFLSLDVAVMPGPWQLSCDHEGPLLIGQDDRLRVERWRIGSLQTSLSCCPLDFSCRIINVPVV